MSKEAVVEEANKLKIIRVDKPELWPEASKVKDARLIGTVKGPLKFNLTALSYADNERINRDNPDPTPPMVERGRFKVPNPEDNAHLDALAAVQFRRYVAVIDLCAFKIPGEELDEKVDWVQNNIHRAGDVMNLYVQIAKLSGFESGQKVDDGEEVMISKPEDWINASKAPTIFGFERSGTRLDFILKGIPGAKVKQIDAATNPGNPPTMMTKDPRGGRRGIPQPNPEAPAYKRKCEEMADARNVMMLEASLPFQIPGDSMQKKSQWLGLRPAWEVLKLSEFLRLDVLSYRSDVDFS